MKLPRPMKEIINDWVVELSVKLRRSESQILEKGLSAYDFSPSSSVEVRYPSGLTHRFTFAFAVVRPEARLAAVFSEHAGYLEFELVEDCVVAEIHEDIYHQET